MTLKGIRISTALRTADCELPEAFALATFSAAALAKGSPRDQRRSRSKALKLAERVEAMAARWERMRVIDVQGEEVST